MVQDYINNMPLNMGDSFEHYYRRKGKFYFRTLDKKNSITFIVAPHLIEEIKMKFKLGNVYLRINGN